MALKLSPKQTKFIVEKLNEAYAEQAKSPSLSREEFKADYSLDEIKAWLGSVEKTVKNKDGDTKELIPDGVDPVAMLNRLGETLDHDRMQQFLNSYVSAHVENKKDPLAFKTVTGAKTKQISVSTYFWNYDDEDERKKNGPLDAKFFQSMKDAGNHVDTGDILKKLSSSDRNALLGKLAFTAKWEQYDDKSGWTLKAEVPVKKRHYLNFTFNAPRFLKSADERLKRPNLPAVKDGEGKEVQGEEALVDQLAEVIDKILSKEIAYYGTEEYAMEGDNGQYAIDDGNNRDMSAIKEDMDDEISTVIDRMEALEIDEEDIKKALADSSEDEYNEGYRRLENSFGTYYLSSEEQIEFSHGSGNNEIEEPTLPYPNDLNANIALLSKEGADELKKKVVEGSINIKWDASKDAYQLEDTYLHLGDDRSVHAIVDEAEFISKAKRMIKDAKLARKGAAASLDPYPVVSALIAEDEELDPSHPLRAVRHPLIAALIKKS